VIAIDTGAVLVGELPSRALKLVSGWATLHRADLEANWSRARDGGPPKPIDPLPCGPTAPISLHGDFEPASHVAHR
jgi:hypothetical protein